MESSTSTPAGSLQPFLIWLFYPVPVVNAICVESQVNFLQTNTHILRSKTTSQPADLWFLGEISELASKLKENRWHTEAEGLEDPD